MKKMFAVLLIIILVFSVFGESLWRKGQMNLISVKKASEVGDIVKVLVYEIPTASTKSSGFNPFKGIADFLSGLLGKVTGQNPTNYIPLDSLESEYKRENQVSAKVVLEISSTVTGKDEHGNLLIEGKKKIKIGGAMKEIIIKGKVRPEDITADNTLDSRNLAEAEVWIDDEVMFKKSPDEPDSWLTYFLSIIAGIFM